MADANEQWQINNEVYLAAAFEWLRLRLTRLAPRMVPASDDTMPAGSQNPGADAGGPLVISGPSVSGSEALDDQIAAAAAKLEAAEKAEPPPAMVILSEKLGLSGFEREILLLCAAFELDAGFAGLFARAHDDPNKAYPTFGLAVALSDAPVWTALSPNYPLRHLHLLEINQPPSQPLTASALRIDERILGVLKGFNEYDDRLMAMLSYIEQTPIGLPGSQQSVSADIMREIEQAAGSASRLPAIELVGIDSASKQMIASRVAREFDLELYRLPGEMMPANTAELENLIRLFHRELLLKPLAIYFDGSELTPEMQSIAALRRFISEYPGLLFLDTRDAWNGIDENVVVFDVFSPTPTEQKEAWAAELGAGLDNGPPDSGEDIFASRLANQFNLSLPVIQRISQNALSDPADKGELRDRVWDMCRANTRPRLDMLAQRIDPKATWKKLVLPDAASQLLERIVEQVLHRGTVYDDWGFRDKMNRGLGVSALFAGDSGTGKTMAAEVIARELRLNLYRIDLSGVVNKYIGETEKNLRRLFDAAEKGGAILFFDEADAIFGKRSEVKDSHDRYANIEINYLLQRLENYTGLAILATNMKNALDSAFLRRLRFVVEFPFPGKAERTEIWRNVFPPGTPTSGLDYERLGNFKLSGGSINNIALGAAFRATGSNPAAVTMPVIFDSVRIEFNKLGLPVYEADFALPPESPDKAKAKAPVQ